MLLNCEQPVEDFSFSQNTRNNQICLCLSLEEISHQIQELKNLKLSREDEIVAELLKNAGKELTQRNNHLIVGNRKNLEDWKTAMIWPMHKKGDRKNYNNYREIAILNVAHKIFTNCC